MKFATAGNRTVTLAKLSPILHRCVIRERAKFYISCMFQSCIEATSIEPDARVVLAICDSSDVKQRWVEMDGMLLLANTIYTAVSIRRLRLLQIIAMLELLRCCRAEFFRVLLHPMSIFFCVSRFFLSN